VVAVGASRPAHDPFLLGRRGAPTGRWEQIRYVYTRIPVDDPGFREAARRFAVACGPEHDVNAEDTAFFFTASLGTVRGVGDAPVLATLCLYEDGTPERWSEGEADCFAGHAGFSERFVERWQRLPEAVPRDAREYLALRDTCQATRGMAGETRADRCRDDRLEALRASVETAYSRDQLDAWAHAAGTLPEDGR